MKHFIESVISSRQYNAAHTETNTWQWYL